MGAVTGAGPFQKIWNGESLTDFRQTADFIPKGKVFPCQSLITGSIFIQFRMIFVVKIKDDEPAGIPACDGINTDNIRTVFHFSGQMVENCTVIENLEILMSAFLARVSAVVLFRTQSVLVISIPAGTSISLVLCPLCVELFTTAENRAEESDMF